MLELKIKRHIPRCCHACGRVPQWHLTMTTYGEQYYDVYLCQVCIGKLPITEESAYEFMVSVLNDNEVPF